MRAVHKYISFFSILFILFIYSYSSQAAQEKEFFSYNRLFLNNVMIDEVSSDGLMQKEMASFVINYRRGIEAIANGDLEFAEDSLKKARKAWPEYFQTDFLLALVYEEKQEDPLAARYYKSYLNKLKSFEENKYRISAPLIKSFMKYPAPSYDSAYIVIADRLREKGISLQQVKPVYNLPFFVLPGILLGVVIVLYLHLTRHVWPYLKRLRRINNPPEGFWVCIKCGKENPVLRNECEQCGNKYPKA